MKICFFILLVLLHNWALAEPSKDELPYLFIPPVQTPADFTEFENQLVNKLVIKGCTKQTIYQVMIGTPDVTKKFKLVLHNINVKIIERSDGFEIAAELRDARKAILINSIKENQFPQIELYRRLEDIINRLFLPVEKDKKSETKEKLPKSKTEIQVAATESQVANINFRERIMNLKTDVNDAIAKAGNLNADKKKVETPKDSDATTSNKKPTPATAAANAEGDLLGLGDAAVPIKPKVSPPLDVGHSVRVGYYNVNTNSVDNTLDVDAHPKYLLFDYEYALALPQKSNYYTHFNVRYGKAMNKDEKEFAPYMGGLISEGYFFESLGWLPKIGIEMDTISFKNLPESGQGLKIANNTLFWFNVTSVNNIKIFSRGFRLSLGYSKPFKIMSSYQGLDKGPKLVGSKLNFTFAMLNIYKKFHLEINYFKSDIEATSERVITFDTTGAGLNAFYNF